MKVDLYTQDGTFIEAQIDTSFKAHLKWEEQFQKAQGMTLMEYYSIASSWKKNPTKMKANMLGILKLIYCFVNSPKLPTFSDFCGLITPQTIEKNLNAITHVLDEVSKSAVSEKN